MLSKKRQRRIHIALMVLAWLALQVLIMSMNVVPSMRQYTPFCGVVQGFQYGVCLVIVILDNEKGSKVATILLAIGLIMSVFTFVRGAELNVVAGMCNNIFYIVTITILDIFFGKRRKEANTDQLTGLLNRRGLYKLVRDKIDEGKSFHVVSIKMNNLKYINSNHGHAIGDKILITAARNMQQLVGKDGSLARFSGSDIVLVLKGDCNPVEKTTVVLDALKKKIILDDGGMAIECFVEAYAGVSSYPTDAHTVNEIFKHADIAMLAATNRKKEACIVYDDQMDASVNREFEVERLIKKALSNNGFYFVYQPQFEMKDKKLRGFEALIRMNMPGEQNVMPGEFIKVAERSDLISSIDKYVLNNVLKQFKAMVGDNERMLGISINISVATISNPEFPDELERIIRENELQASCVEIEITEYCLAESADVIISNIRRLRDMSVKVALDDFGTGYTSLSYLANMPINLLKIDKTLVDNIVSDKKNYDFISAIIAMGHLMGCEVISEGVESEEQIDMLKSKECDYIQGFAWGRPLTFDDAAEIVKQLR